MNVKEFVDKAKVASNFCSKQTGKSKLYHYVDMANCIIRYGCSIRQYSVGGFYKYRSFDRSKIMTYRGWIKIMNICNDPSAIHLLENKSEFNEYFNEFVHRKWMGPKEIQEQGKVGIEKFIRECGSVIVKPIDDMEGRGIYVLKSSDDMKEAVAKIVEGNVVVEEFIKQHPQMVFGNKSVNTIRMFTILDKQGEVHFIKAILRCGVGDTIVDNYCAGGVIYPIDVKNGIVEDAGMNFLGQECVQHPGTDIIMLGYPIPHWDEVKDVLTKASKHIPAMRFVGWDVAVTLNGVDIIEGNHNPLFELIEFLGKTGHYKDMLKYAMN